jgi:hypothetical protein
MRSKQLRSKTNSSYQEHPTNEEKLRLLEGKTKSSYKITILKEPA